MARVITETVPVQMTYDEYSVYDNIARQHGMSVPDTILRLAAVGARLWADQLEQGK